MYSRISDVPDNLRNVSPSVDGQAIQLSLAQVNVLADIYDKYKNDDGNAIEKAKDEFRKLYLVNNGKWVKKMIEESTGIFDEMWLKVPGSYEDFIIRMQAAVSEKYNEFKAKSSHNIAIRATFKNSVIVETWEYPDDNDGRIKKYYSANWSKNNDDIEFSNIEEVKLDIAIKKVNESKELVEQVREGTNTVDLNETILTDVMLNEVEIDGKKIFRGKIPIAQKADIRNKNGRKYRASALKEATENAKKIIEKYGALRMEGAHYLRPDGKNDNQLIRTAALIKNINWHEDTKTVSLDEVELVPELEQGHAVKALLERGYKLQVSQRAVGSSKMVKEDDGTLVEDVFYVKFQGWDFLPGGEASVGDANFEVITEGLEMPEKVLDEKQTIDLVQNSIKEAQNSITEGLMNTLRDAGILVEQEDGEEGPIEIVAESTDNEKVESLLREIKSLNERIDNGEKVTTELKREKEISYLNQFGKQLLESELADDKYKRFNDNQKKRLIDYVKPAELYGKVNPQDTNEVTAALVEMLNGEVVKMDAGIADLKLKELGLMDEDGQIRKMSEHGVTRIEVNEQIPGMEYMAKLEKAVEDRMKNTDSWVMPKEHSSQFALDAILKEFDEQNWQLLQQEAKTLTEQVTQSSIGPRVAMISRTLIPIAWRRLTALQVMDVGPTMGSRIVDIPVSAWSVAETAELATDVGSIMVADDADIPVGGISYTNYPLYAIRLALSTEIRSEAIATAKGTSMNPVADSLAGLTRDISTRLDRLFWQMMITKAQMLTSSYTEETTYQDMIDLGSNVWAFSGDDGTTAIDGGVLRYEWVKSVDGNGNPTGADIVRLYGTAETANTLQEIVVQDDDDTALIYETDYSVNWLDGTISLTATGIAKVNEGLEAKFTFSNASGTYNTNFWSVTPPTGITLYDHLINLRQKIGQSKVLISNRHYSPNFIAMSMEIEDLIASGPRFIDSGRSPAEIMDRLVSDKMRLGLTPIKSSAIPNGYLIIGEMGAAAYRVHTPLKMVGPYKVDIKGHDYYHVEEYSGFDVPVMKKLSLVMVTDL